MIDVKNDNVDNLFAVRASNHIEGDVKYKFLVFSFVGETIKSCDFCLDHVIISLLHARDLTKRSNSRSGTEQNPDFRIIVYRMWR